MDVKQGKHWAAAILFTASTLSCAPRPTCVAGVVESCSGPGGCSGAQQCLSDGTFAPCVCAVADGGGSDSGVERDAGSQDAGAADAGVDAGPPVSYSVQIQFIWNTYCVGCHAGATPSANLDLSTGHAWGALVNVPTTCDAGLRVVPFQPDASMLWLKLENAPQECGGYEPNGSPCGPLSVFAPAQFDLVTRWIEQGALDN